MKKRNVLKETGVLLVAAMFVLTSIVIVPMTMADPPPEPEHDVGVTNVNSPLSGPATASLPVEVTVENFGQSDESDVPVNVVIEKEGGIIEYDETEYIDIVAGDQIDLEFPTWTPNDWQVSENIDIDYTVTACTMMDGDEVPANDCQTEIITLHYPYLHDVCVVNIDSPAEDGPAQTLPVKVTIKNVGQFTECCFKTNVQISEIGSTPEYDDQIAVGYIEPGEEIELTFDDWTPEFLAEGISRCIDYEVVACTKLLGDTNPANDCKTETLTLCSYDIRVKEITEPPRCLSLGTFPVQAIVENVGSVAVMDLTCDAEIREFITDPSGTLIYEDEVANIDLDVGDTIIVTFCDFYFGYEGKYQVTICIPCVGDVNPGDNCLTKELFFDETPPITTHTLDPPAPDGLNGWYISCVTVTLDATDTLPGVDATYYRLDGGAWILYAEPFVVCDCGEHIVEYYSVDVCGNMEPANSVSFKVDTSLPEITQIGEPIDLWPPDHKYHTIEISECVISVTDICDPDVSIDDIIITSVSSDEPEEVTGEGDGYTYDDIVIVDAQTVKLRSERQGDGNGRVYTINFEVTDISGNTATGTCKVWVRHDQSGDPAIDDGADAGYTVYP